jgi:hypothetical protein
MPPAPSPRSLLLLLPLALLLAGAALRPAQAAADENGFVTHGCPIEGQTGAVVLGREGDFQAACLSLSKPREPGPWSDADADRVTGSARFCPRPVLALLDQEGVMTVRFLPLAEGSYLADPAACCLGGRISVNPKDGRVRIATDGPGPDCLGGSASAAHEDIYRWDGTELRFLETRTEEAPPPE